MRRAQTMTRREWLQLATLAACGVGTRKYWDFGGGPVFALDKWRVRFFWNNEAINHLSIENLAAARDKMMEQTKGGPMYIQPVPSFVEYEWP